MKRNLGRFLAVFLLLCSVLEASTYQWSLEQTQKSSVTNEAVYFQYKCTFSDKSELYVIEFNPAVENENYAIKLLSEQEQIENNHRINSFEFVLFVKKAGYFDLDLTATMKKTNKDSIENTVLGRDNGMYEEYSIKKVDLEPIELEVKSSDEKLVGEYTSEQKGDTKEIEAYEPYHITYTISGIGDFQTLQPFHFAIEGVKIFAEEPTLQTELTPKGYKGVWQQKFAFVGTKDFTIPSQKLSYFDLKEGVSKVLETKPSSVHVKEAAFKKEELLDQEVTEEFHFDKVYLYYFFTFIAGLLIGRISLKTKKKQKDVPKSFCEKLANVKNIDQLLMMLIVEDAQNYKDLIEKIEKQEIQSIKQAKKLICP